MKMSMKPDGGSHEPSHLYRHEEEKPSLPKHGHQESGLGCHDFKGEAAPIAYGQAGEAGCSSDSKKFASQMKHYDWESPSDY